MCCLQSFAVFLFISLQLFIARVFSLLIFFQRTKSQKTIKFFRRVFQSDEHKKRHANIIHFFVLLTFFFLFLLYIASSLSVAEITATNNSVNQTTLHIELHESIKILFCVVLCRCCRSNFFTSTVYYFFGFLFFHIFAHFCLYNIKKAKQKKRISFSKQQTEKEVTDNSECNSHTIQHPHIF